MSFYHPLAIHLRLAKTTVPMSLFDLKKTMDSMMFTPFLAVGAGMMLSLLFAVSYHVTAVAGLNGTWIMFLLFHNIRLWFGAVIVVMSSLCLDAIGRRQANTAYLRYLVSYDGDILTSYANNPETDPQSRELVMRYLNSVRTDI